MSSQMSLEDQFLNHLRQHKVTKRLGKKRVFSECVAAGQKDVQTLAKYEKAVPFDIYLKPKPIINENPWTSVQPFVKLEDARKSDTIKTRPRVIMSPAFSLDDIKDDRSRNVIIEDTYKTIKMTDFTVSVTQKLHSPLPLFMSPSVMVKLPSSHHVVHPEWRMESVSWDRRQKRLNLCTTTEFWKRTLAK